MSHTVTSQLEAAVGVEAEAVDPPAPLVHGMEGKTLLLHISQVCRTGRDHLTAAKHTVLR